MKIYFIRHGKTKGNLEKRYIGVTDEDLCSEGIEEIIKIKYPYVQRVISSPMKRCIQTAEIVYSEKEIEIYEELRECDFGDFENKNFEELKNNEQYIKWLESMGKMSFPNGENHNLFCKRCCDCFEKIMKENTAERTAFVVHGGTVMAVLEKFAGGNFYDWHIKNVECLCFDVSIENKKIILRKQLWESRKIHECEFLSS